jgi:predicted metal-dependent hydrolase
LVRHPRARRYIIRVTEDGGIRVTVPRWGSKKDALAFADSERAWIEQQQQRMEQERARRAQEAADGPGRDALAAERRALIARARRELPARLFELAARHALTVSKVSIRNQKWRWGSCSRNGHICLNWRLVQMPDAVRDYVLIHELMHLRRLDHSPKFWKLVAEACPDYRALRRQLLQAPNDR